MRSDQHFTSLVRRITALCTLVLALSGLAASHATATDYTVNGWEIDFAVDTSLTCPNSSLSVSPWGTACFKPDGDHFVVRDISGDGRRVGVIWQMVGGGRKGICQNTGGSGSIRQCNKNLPEFSYVFYFVARCDGSAVNCDLVSNWRDGGTEKTLYTGGMA